MLSVHTETKSGDFHLDSSCLKSEKLRSLDVLGPVHTNLFSNKNGAVLLRFKIKNCVHTYRPHVSFSPVHTTTSYPL